MPEGDTVWQAARRLHSALAGKVLTRSDLRVPRFATADLTGRTVLDVTPRGKHLLTRIEGGLTLHSHLRMDGAWKVFANGQRWTGGPAHQIRVILGNAERTAVGYRLPVLELLRTADEDRAVGHLGPDLLGPDWDPEVALANLLKDPDRPLGEALLDQRNLAGIGNVFKSELCFLLGVTPWLPVGALPGDRAAYLPELAKALLDFNRERPIRRTTTTTTPANMPPVVTGPPAPTGAPPHTGRRPSRASGTAANRGPDLFVHGRAPRPCLRCGTLIRVADQGDGSRERPTYWCPTCQRGPAPEPRRPRRDRTRPTG
ncbi:Fpg/Nei family DNA glycosylase [Streptomyces thermocarboxydovorans]|uniref:DNA-(apurinic or apyrimidinic site) lyase n=1 Tax=Streptomyces thermocarboxydovorans TaxID=59298 RepID=A0ABN1HA57_9ACTN